MKKSFYIDQREYNFSSGKAYKMNDMVSERFLFNG